MSSPSFVTLDGNEAAARVAYALSEVAAIYPITPSSVMGELADDWSTAGRPNLWGCVPRVVEMQSEAGAIGALHGALSAGSLCTTFTASQGLLLMLPDLYKIAGELTPFVAHVAARAVAAHALSIFGDHSDVMAARTTGLALLSSGSVQEAMDLAAVAHAATLESRVPFLHFFDGFRTSHEIQKIQALSDDDLRAMIPLGRLLEHRRRGLSPDHPTIRGTAQNPDVFFQGREAGNRYYTRCPEVVQQAMDRLGARTGRRYRLFDYTGHPAAERVVVMMGSGAEAAERAADALNARGQRCGVLRVRLYRPFAASAFLSALPRETRAVAVLDRTKEAGSHGEPLFLDVAAALAEARRAPLVIGGRYGLGSKEFTPGMAAAVFAELAAERPKSRFAVGIRDDVSGASLDWDPSQDAEDSDGLRAVFFGLGADGTVGANKSAVKLVSETTDLHAQAYFVYDSKKSGGTTISHLRFSPRPIRAPYLIREAGFVACHQESLLERLDVLGVAAPGGTLLLNTRDPENAWTRLPAAVRAGIVSKGLRVFVVDAYRLARECGLGGRINTVMQACFLEITRLLPEHRERLKQAARDAYGDRGPAVVAANVKALELAAAALRELPVPREVPVEVPGVGPAAAVAADGFASRVTLPLISGRGDELPVSALPDDGTWPVGTARLERRRLADKLPVWSAELCIQCDKCALVCPHSAIRAKVYEPAGAPEGFKSAEWRGREFPEGSRYTIQVAPDDCTGCELCVEICPAHDRGDPARKALSMTEAEPLREAEQPLWRHFLALPQATPAPQTKLNVKLSQLRRPLFEFSGACTGCGETPYLKLLTQLFGDRMVVANATGCSSIYGGNLPTTPWCAGADGRGPAWSNSLFEDNAEFGLGFRLAFDQQAAQAASLVGAHAAELGEALCAGLLAADQSADSGIALQRSRVAELKRALKALAFPWARQLEAVADSLVKRSVWIVGGDGWAYDIGYGGLDHVLRSGADVNVLVLDTEVYSNTGGQASKATPRGAVARFASAGKAQAGKDLALEAAVAGGAYVARVALGAHDAQTLRAFTEAEAYPGPSLIVAYAPCIAHGISMCDGLTQQKLAVRCGHWPLFRFDPRKEAQGRPGLELDSKAPDLPFREYALREGRFASLHRDDPRRAESLLSLAQADIERRWRLLSLLAGQPQHVKEAA